MPDMGPAHALVFSDMTVIAEELAAAREQADRAAERSGVRIAALHDPDEVGRIPAVVEAVWGDAVVPTSDILRALARAGAVLLAAEPIDQPGETVGAAFGFLGWERGLHLHSHQVGVLPRWQGTGVGYALKLAQRVTCLDHGVTEMRWTFDPMLARNARFNFGKLGVSGVAFLPDFYGRMADGINAGDASDRFEVSWRLNRPITARVDESCGRELLTTDDAGLPRRTDIPPAPGARVPIPSNYAGLREAGDHAAGAWRQAARSAFTECFQAGLVAVAFGQHGYLFDEEVR